MNSASEFQKYQLIGIRSRFLGISISLVKLHSTVPVIIIIINDLLLPQIGHFGIFRRVPMHVCVYYVMCDVM